MKSNLIDNLYLVFFDPLEFPFFYEDLKSSLSEFIVTFISAFSLSISMAYISPPYTELSLATIVPFLLFNLVFLNFYPKLYSFYIDYKIKKESSYGEIQQMISYVRYSMGLIAFILPISTISLTINFKGFSAFFLILLFILFIVIINVARGITSIYKLQMNKSFILSLNSVIILFILPISIIFYYLVIVFGVLAQ